MLQHPEARPCLGSTVGLYARSLREVPVPRPGNNATPSTTPRAFELRASIPTRSTDPHTYTAWTVGGAVSQRPGCLASWLAGCPVAGWLTVPTGMRVPGGARAKPTGQCLNPYSYPWGWGACRGRCVHGLWGGLRYQEDERHAEGRRIREGRTRYTAHTARAT